MMKKLFLVLGVCLFMAHSVDAALINVAEQSNGGVATANINSGHAQYTNDGNTVGSHTASHDVWHADNSNGTAVLNIALGSYTGLELKSIVIFGRHDCCQDRLDDFKVELLDAGSSVLFTHTSSTQVVTTSGTQSLPTAGLELTLSSGITTATTLRITDLQTVDAHFGLAEAQVFADVVPEPSSSILIILGLAGIGLASRQRRRKA